MPTENQSTFINLQRASMLVPQRAALKQYQKPLRLAVLGATGSIGASTFDIVRQHQEDFAIVALHAHSRWERLLPLIEEFNPETATLVDEQALQKLAAAMAKTHATTRLLSTREFYSHIELGSFDVAVCANVGFDGIHGSLAAARSGRRVALANKESLVAAGALLQTAVKSSGAQIIPLDSEHSSLYQLLLGHSDDTVIHCTLTASGGPFLDLPESEWDRITPEEAVRHPRWTMGPKISIDSATMINKGLELIEAHWLFGFSEQEIEVLVHPQSFVHGSITFADGSTVCHAAATDMRLPIAFALRCPEGRYTLPAPLKSLADVGTLSFRQLDEKKFRAVSLARQALRQGGASPAVYTIANDVAVERFLKGRQTFPKILQQVEQALHKFGHCHGLELDSLLDLQHQIGHLLNE